jgi:outer membrane protein TolC
VGLLPEIDAAAVRAEVARREQGLILAESLREERRLQLLRLIGHDPGVDFEPAVRPSSDARTEAVPITDLEDRLLLADRSRPDLAEARLRLEQERLETVITRNGILPKLDLFLALGGTGYAETFSGSLGELGSGTYDFEAGIRFSQFIGNRSAKARDREARASRQQAAEAVRNLEQLVRFDVRLAANRVESARRQIAASEATRLFQEESLEAEQERFAVGAGTALLVAQAQRDLLVSQIAEITSIVNYRIARAQLYRAEGSLLALRGIQLAAAE